LEAAGMELQFIYFGQVDWHDSYEPAVDAD